MAHSITRQRLPLRGLVRVMPRPDNFTLGARERDFLSPPALSISGVGGPDANCRRRYPGVVAALASLPDETVIDGEVVALDASGKPVFSLLQNGGTNVYFYGFDLL